MAARQKNTPAKPVAPLFDGPEDSLTAAKSLLSTLSTTADCRSLDDDEIYYTLALASRLIEEGMDQYGKAVFEAAKAPKAATGAGHG